MFRVVLQSRLGNIALAVVGALYVILAIALLVYHASVGTAGLKDILLNLILAGAVVAGAWIVANSAANLGIRLRRARR